MASKIVSIEAVPIHTPDDPENVIWIRPRMDVGVQGLVRSAMVSLQTQASTNGATPNSANLKFDVGAYNVALLVHNVVRWEGSGFEGLPCNAENIKRLDPDDDLLALVLQEINDRNLTKVASPNSSNGNGKSDSTPSTARTKQAASRQTSPA